MWPPFSDSGLDVRPACDGPTMNDTMQLRGIELRYVLTMHLLSHGPASITELADAVAWHGFAVAGRASKSISDALRWEMGYGRVRRLGRGLYGPGWMPRGTEHRIHKRVMALRHQASCRCEAGTSSHPKFLETAGAIEPGRQGPLKLGQQTGQDVETFGE
jgi:hypothetical protein